MPFYIIYSQSILVTAGPVLIKSCKDLEGPLGEAVYSPRPCGCHCCSVSQVSGIHGMSALPQHTESSTEAYPMTYSLVGSSRVGSTGDVT